MNPLSNEFLGAVSNLFAVYYMNDAAGLKVSLAVTAVLVTVMVRADLMGQFLFGVWLGGLQLLGLTLAVIGVAIATLE